jgi:hypothetical protein
MWLQRQEAGAVDEIAPMSVGGIFSPFVTLVLWYFPMFSRLQDGDLRPSSGPTMNFLKEIRWEPTIGDPTFMGWFTVAAYAVAALLAARVWLRKREKIWLLVTIGMAGLCVNKQLDLQSLITAIGRVIAWHEGWLQGICFLREAPERAIGSDRPACRLVRRSFSEGGSLLGLRSFSEVGGVDWRAGKCGLRGKRGIWVKLKC